LGTKDAGQVLGEMLKANPVLKELDLSDNCVKSYNGGDGPGFAQELALGIKDNGAVSIEHRIKTRNIAKYTVGQHLHKFSKKKINGTVTSVIADSPGATAGRLIITQPKNKGAMTKFDISWNDIRAEGGKALAEGLKDNQVIKELNFSNNRLGYNSNCDTDASGIIAIADVIPGMGALLVFSLKSNNLRAAGGKALAEGLKGNQVITELNISNNFLGLYSNGSSDTSGVIALAEAIPGMAALSSLSLSKNGLLTKEAGKVIGDMLKSNSTLKELDLSSNYDYHAGATDGPGFAQELALGIKDNGALKKIDARDNDVDSEGKQALKQAAGSRCVRPCQDVFNHKVLVLTLSALTGSNSCSNPLAIVRPHPHWEGGARCGRRQRDRCGGSSTGDKSAVSPALAEAVAVRCIV
jgi:hypothetical protein